MATKFVRAGSALQCEQLESRICHDVGYAVEELSIPGEGVTITDMNNSGTIVGYFNEPGSERAFIWSKQRGLRELGALGGASSIAFDVNEKGRVVGVSSAADGTSHAFLYDGKRMRDLGEKYGFEQSMATGINDRGQVAITAWGGPGPQRVFLRKQSGLLLVGKHGRSGHVNNDGVISITSSSFKAKAPHRIAYGESINDRGTITRSSRVRGRTWSASAKIPGSFGSIFSIRARVPITISDLNNHDVGLANRETGPVLLSADTTQDLNLAISPDSGWVLSSADVINDAGQIAGIATVNGRRAVYLLTRM